MVRPNERTRRGLIDAILLPGSLAILVAGILVLGRWMGVTA